MESIISNSDMRSKEKLIEMWLVQSPAYVGSLILKIDQLLLVCFLVLTPTRVDYKLLWKLPPEP